MNAPWRRLTGRWKKPPTIISQKVDKIDNLFSGESEKKDKKLDPTHLYFRKKADGV